MLKLPTFIISETWRFFICCIVAAPLFVSGVPSKAFSEEEKLSEEALKMGLIYNLFFYVDWPKKALVLSPEEKWILCVSGRTADIEELGRLEPNHELRGKPIEIKYNVSIEDTLGCHILFVREVGSPPLNSILDFANKKPVLIVGESIGFSNSGGGVELVVNRGNLNFKINKAAIQASGLELSSQLLKLALNASELIDESGFEYANAPTDRKALGLN